jgi:extracellular factor (EF) 3-hydroxypalmitic acid methyl ester biosynthesis protein
MLESLADSGLGSSRAGCDMIIRLCSEFDDACRRATGLPQHSEESIQQLDDHLWELTKQICVEAVSCPDGDRSAIHRSHFEKKVLKWCLLNDAVAELWSKPAGYSGDFRTIELICQNRRSWQKFDDIFLNHLLRSEMANQHRAKVEEQASFVTEILRSRDFPKLLNAGCGPCFDVRLALDRIRSNEEAEIVLIDLDPEALAFSEKQLGSFAANVKVSCLNHDVLRAMRRLCSEARGIGSYDAVLFGGLFDYLPDRIVVLLLSLARRLLRRGGELFFSQVSPANPDRIFMEWYGDWVLLERDEQALLHLCREAGIDPATVTLTRERCGIAILGRAKQLDRA